jgi:hypothetical protein
VIRLGGGPARLDRARHVQRSIARAALGATALLGALLAAACTTDAPYGGNGPGVGGSTAGHGGSAGSATGGGGGGATGGGSGTAGATGAAGSGVGGQVAGNGGTVGTAGAAGGGTGGGAGVATGGGGAAGRGGSGPGGSGGAAASTLKLEYASASAAATTFAVRITNLGPSTPLISVIRARYYFTDDSTNKMNGAAIDSATWHLSAGSDVDIRSTGGCAVISTFPAAPASAYADIGCSLTSPINANDTLTFAVHFDADTQAAANDYSYLATAGAFQANPHMLLILNGQIVSGTPTF